MSKPELSSPSIIVLGMLALSGPATPYDLKARIGASVGNFWTIAHSQIYSEPERLRARGLVDLDEETEGRRRKLYAINAAGREALAAWVAQTPSGMGELRSPALLAIFFGADPVAVAEANIPIHEAKLAEYEELAALADGVPPEAVGGSPDRGPRIALEAGIRSERTWIAYWKDVRAGNA